MGIMVSSLLLPVMQDLDHQLYYYYYCSILLVLRGGVPEVLGGFG